MTVPGYAIERDDRGLTARERQVLVQMQLASLYGGKVTSFVDIASSIGVTRQRVNSVVKSLMEKGFVVKTNSGEYAVVIKR